jgi:hypothetical protein
MLVHEVTETNYAQEIETWLGSNPSRVVTRFVVCKLLRPAFRRAAKMEALINEFIKTRPFPCKRHIFQDHEFACHRLDESEDKRTHVARNEILRLGPSNVSFHNAIGRKVQQTSDPFLTKQQNVLLPPTYQNKTIKSELCKAVNSFFLQEAVKGVSGEEIIFAVKETSNKRAFWNKEKRSSEKDKVGIRKSSSESGMEIEFENDDCGDDISDGGAECLFCTGLFSRDKRGEKRAQCVRCYRWAHEDCGLRKATVCAPRVEKV